MGNSNSLAHYSPDIEEKWHHSLPQPTYQQQIKVLPDLGDGARLRPTNNGVILHSGGTLTGRRESIGAITSGVHRSRSISSSTHHHEMKYKPGALQRHHTQLEMVPNGRNYAAQEMNYKRFGSEPDLRFTEDDIIQQQARNQQQGKMPKGRKKKVPNAPAAQPGYEYDPSRFGWKPRQEIENLPVQQPRKLRLFKTKAESSKKPNNPAKLATEASDMHFRKPFVDRRNKYLRESRPSQDDINLRQPDFSGTAKSKIQLLPMPQYRREKSFDLSLLLSRKKDESKPTPVPNTFRKLSDGKELDVKIAPTNKAKAPTSPIAKTKVRRASQPPQVVGNDFQKELQEATRRRSMAVKLQTTDKAQKAAADAKSPAKEMSPARNYAAPKKAPTSKPLGDIEQKIVAKPKEQITIKVPAPETPIPQPPSQPNPQPAQPQVEKVAPKTFYFGMGDPQSSKVVDLNVEKVENEAIDIFAESILNLKRRPRLTDSSESAMSSDAEENMLQDLAKGDDEMDSISLKLRPTLPKKQFEIPRFSPAAAWRLLSSAADTEKEFNPWKIEKPDNFSSSDRPPDTSSRNEERIERIYREPIPGLPDNKSGDSGISGDAGLLELTDTSPINVNSATGEDQKLGPFLSPWTPQQDLGEESSSDGDELKDKAQKEESDQKHAFSLSLPRESSIYSDKVDKQSFNSLQRLRRTVSGALNGHSEPGQLDIPPYRNDNWFLSRSAPNSIEKNPLPSISDQEDIDKDIPPPMNIVPSMQPPSFSYLAGGKHFMYLPHRSVVKSDSLKEKSPPVKREEETQQNHRESLQDSPAPWTPPVMKTSKSKNHRFTFQSTVRQIERRRLAEKLSKEAEQKEAQRLSELEAMRRVEEEFQKKRAREKASIRQQLRMFSLEENGSNCTSLPPEWQVNTARADPDGAVSSPTPSPTAEDGQDTYKRDARKLSDDMSIFMPPPMSRKPLHTEILSEMRLSGRRYFDYKPENASFGNRANHLPQIVGHIPARRDVEEAMRF
ncbi:uncharacterized protein LOC129788048 [Lutzomyia longipalpis]|uniref:uncharacterized protein LOC129788048 n=1 Tax=Lutzomyia longipalpis TaxID=7200 RepID=UPI00248400AA|nr:uncharacterized protein LOC129788048 [Lutzomyia longipalpis]